ncbi:MAG: hypothetical protein AAGI03_15265 [Pseudomonadota bacterium]
MEAWVFWMLAGFAFWFFAIRGSACSARRAGGKRRRRAYRDDSAEVAHLKSQLEARDGQIDLLTRRLEALETIITDEDRRLRREFDALQRS